MAHVTRLVRFPRGARSAPKALWAFGACVAFVCVHAPLEAQGLTAQGWRDLRFGTVVAGLPTSVPRTDLGRAALYQIRGTANAEVLVQLTLPTVLTNAGGQTMPISFGPNDGGFGGLPVPFFMTAFDPTVPLIQRLAFFGRLFIALGGTVSPPITATAGQYTNTITLTVAYTGN